MTHQIGLLTRTMPLAVSVYGRVIRILESLIPLFDLSVRLYLAHIFWKGGLVKLSSWMSTVMLFTMVYDVPILSPEVAAFLSTTIELGGSFLLAIGLGGRWAALALFGLNIVAVLSYGQLSEAARQEAFYWGILFCTSSCTDRVFSLSMPCCVICIDEINEPTRLREIRPPKWPMTTNRT